MEANPFTYSTGFESYLKVVLRDPSTGTRRPWNTSGTPAFEVYNPAHIANYGISVTEPDPTGSPGTYVWEVPEDLPAVTEDFEYEATVYLCAGTTLATGDLAEANEVWLSVFPWDGGSFDFPSIVTGPGTPDVVVGYLDVFDAMHAPLAGALLDFRFVDTDANGESHPGDPFSIASDDDGLLQCNFKPSANYEGRRNFGQWVAFTTPSAGTFALPGVLGGE